MSIEPRAKPYQRVWMYVADATSPDDLRDLDHLDSVIWGANPNTRKGDLVVMYRTAPYADLPYIFTALSDPRPVPHAQYSYMPLVITLGAKQRVHKPVTLADLRRDPVLSEWSVSRSPQGVMRRRRDLVEEKVWSHLSHLLRYEQGVGRRTEGAEQNEPARKDLDLKVFLSYASEDRHKAGRLHRRLVNAGVIEAWFDQRKLVTGDDWLRVIEKALVSSEAAIICFSPNSVQKIGFVNAEIAKALEVADLQPEGTTFIMPVMFEPCEMPNRLARWQCAKLFEKNGFGSLIEGLRRRQKFIESNRRRKNIGMA